jgi:O-antigen/teichoic acid export membrane protein
MKAAPRLIHNIVANYLGKAWVTVLSLAFVPLYIKLMGVEVYGLIGIFMSIGAILSLLDMGLSATLSRELSRLSALKALEKESQNLLRTFELIYWGVGTALGLTVIFMAEPITTHWINSASVPHDVVFYSLVIMGFSIIFQWPGSLYSGGLAGIQRQVGLNVIRSVMATLQHGGAIIVLLFISPSILVFFAWQALIGLITTIFLGGWLWANLSTATINPSAFLKTRFKKSLLFENWRFAGGITGISLTTVALTQIDKVILSKMLTLEAFGFYVLAFNIANALQNFVTPLASSILPRITQLAAVNDKTELASLYHKACQLLSVIVLPVAITIASFAEELLFIWLGPGETSRNTAPLLSLLMIGTAMNALVSMPYSVQLAYGRTKLVLYSNLVAVTLLTPLMFWLVLQFHSVGACWAWVILNTAYLIILVPIMHRRLLRDELGEWYKNDILKIALPPLLITTMTRLALPSWDIGLWILVPVTASLLLSFAGCFLLAGRLNKGFYKK